MTAYAMSELIRERLDAEFASKCWRPSSETPAGICEWCRSPLGPLHPGRILDGVGGVWVDARDKCRTEITRCNAMHDRRAVSA